LSSQASVGASTAFILAPMHPQGNQQCNKADDQHFSPGEVVLMNKSGRINMNNRQLSKGECKWCSMCFKSSNCLIICLVLLVKNTSVTPQVFATS
jgi:hypothetical protein